MTGTADAPRSPKTPGWRMPPGVRGLPVAPAPVSTRKAGARRDRRRARRRRLRDWDGDVEHGQAGRRDDGAAVAHGPRGQVQGEQPDVGQDVDRRADVCDAATAADVE